MQAVYVPEWGETVYVRAMGVTEKTAFEIECLGPKGTSRDDATRYVRERLLARTVCDETGARLYNDAESSLIADHSALPWDRVFRVANRLNLEVGDAEELAKNFDGTQG